MGVHTYTFRRSDVHTVTRWHAVVTWAVDAPDKSQYTGIITCQHDHLDKEAADKCQSRLVHRINNNPHLFPEVQQAMLDVEGMQADQDRNDMTTNKEG